MEARVKSALRRALGSLECKLTGVIFALAVTISCSLAAYLPARQASRLRGELDRKALTLARLTSHQVESAIAFGDRETAREVFEAVMLDTDVAGLALLTADGRTVGSAGRIHVDPDISHAERLSLLDHLGVVRSVAPVVSKEGPRGVIVVDLALASLEVERATLFGPRPGSGY